jgi:hypothetical protein
VTGWFLWLCAFCWKYGEYKELKKKQICKKQSQNCKIWKCKFELRSKNDSVFASLLKIFWFIIRLVLFDLNSQYGLQYENVEHKRNIVYKKLSQDEGNSKKVKIKLIRLMYNQQINNRASVLRFPLKI